MRKLAIFDLDGTLIDSLPDIVENINVMLKKFGHEQRTYDEIRRFIGNGARKLVEESIGESLNSDDFEKRLEYYNKIYTESGSPNTRLYDGIEQTLLELKKRGYLLAVLTNKPQSTTDTVIKNYFSFIEFDRVVGQRNGVKCKPDKAATLNILAELDVSINDCVFIGDGETDFLTAKNCKIPCISVLWGYRDLVDLESVGANLFINCPKQLLDLL